MQINLEALAEEIKPCDCCKNKGKALWPTQEDDSSKHIMVTGECPFPLILKAWNGEKKGADPDEISCHDDKRNCPKWAGKV
ncbi:MAG: hypothetical protein AB1523_09770 [Bacillota bacterium]